MLPEGRGRYATMNETTFRSRSFWRCVLVRGLSTEQCRHERLRCARGTKTQTHRVPSSSQSQFFDHRGRGIRRGNTEKANETNPGRQHAKRSDGLEELKALEWWTTNEQWSNLQKDVDVPGSWETSIVIRKPFFAATSQRKMLSKNCEHSTAPPGRRYRLFIT